MRSQCSASSVTCRVCVFVLEVPKSASRTHLSRQAAKFCLLFLLELARYCQAMQTSYMFTVQQGVTMSSYIWYAHIKQHTQGGIRWLVVQELYGSFCWRSLLWPEEFSKRVSHSLCCVRCVRSHSLPRVCCHSLCSVCCVCCLAVLCVLSRCAVYAVSLCCVYRC